MGEGLTRAQRAAQRADEATEEMPRTPAVAVGQSRETRRVRVLEFRVATLNVQHEKRWLWTSALTILNLGLVLADLLNRWLNG